MSQPTQDASDDAQKAAGARDANAWRSPAAYLWFFGLIAVVLAADLWVKYWAFENVALLPVQITELAQTDHAKFWRQYPHDARVVVPGVLNLRLTTNTGAVFGIGKGWRWFFILVSVIATGIISMMFARSRAGAWVFHAALALILAGALGNLYDRVVYGVVRDMFHLLPTTNLWPWIFNLADASLMLGVGMVLVLTFIHDREHKTRATGRTP